MEPSPIPGPVTAESTTPEPHRPRTDVPITANPLDRYSLTGKSAEIEKQAAEEKPVLGEVALRGQATVFYAAPNTGKTLITLALLVDGIRQHRVNPSSVYYLNMDDTHRGVLEKLRIAEEHGFQLLAEGHCDFSADHFRIHIEEMVAKDQARDVVIVLDTLKKFVNLMDKTKSSNFAALIRKFVMKGGTLIALAHTNKKAGQDGKPVYGGTSDIIDDFDCAYTLAAMASQAGSSEKVVEFENKKRRGNVVPSAAYSYSTKLDIAYADLLLSVLPVDAAQIEPIKQSAQAASDSVVIGSIVASIRAGITMKMDLRDAVARDAGVSRRNALDVIERYSGDEPAKHFWKYTVQERGAKVYALLDRTELQQGPDETER